MSFKYKGGKMLEATTTLYVNPHELAEICNHGSKNFILAITQPFGPFNQAINIPLKHLINAQHNNHDEHDLTFAKENDLLNDYLTLRRNLSGAISNGMVYKIKRGAFTILIANEK